MAFLVEDGNGLEAANAYISVAFADSYHSLRSNDDWTGDESAKQSAIVQATDYIDRRFGGRFRGVVSSSDQALAFPRSDLYDERGNLIEGVPGRVEKACAEYALRALSQALHPDPDHEAEGLIKSKTEQVGPISESVEYQSARPIPSYPAADNLLRPLLYQRGAVRA